MTKFFTKVRVIATALPTYMVGAAVILTFLSDEIVKLLPADKAETVAAVIVKVVAFLGAAVAIIRRVTPVLPEQVGVLPQGPPSSPVVVIAQDPPVDIPGGQNA